jgi:hypothetical protein
LFLICVSSEHRITGGIGRPLQSVQALMDLRLDAAMQRGQSKFVRILAPK